MISKLPLFDGLGSFVSNSTVGEGMSDGNDSDDAVEEVPEHAVRVKSDTTPRMVKTLFRIWFLFVFENLYSCCNNSIVRIFSVRISLPHITTLQVTVCSEVLCKVF